MTSMTNDNALFQLIWWIHAHAALIVVAGLLATSQALWLVPAFDRTPKPMPAPTGRPLEGYGGAPN